RRFSMLYPFSLPVALPISAFDLFGLDLGDLRSTLTHPQIRIQPGDALVDPVGDRNILRERTPQRVASDRVTTHPHQQLQLRLRRSEEHTSELQSRFDHVCR